MRYAFTCIAILVIWLALLIMSIVSNQNVGSFLHDTALVLTVILFVIVFRKQ